MSNPPIPPIVPLDDNDFGAEPDVATREVDGDEVLDPDADDDLIDSAEADRLATDPDATTDDRP